MELLAILGACVIGLGIGRIVGLLSGMDDR